MRKAPDCRSPSLTAVPVAHFSLRLVLRIAITILKAAFQLVLFAGNYVQIIVGQFAPLFFDLTLHLLLVAFDSVPIHR